MMKPEEFIKKLVRAWDPDFTKLTPEEARRVDEAEKGEFIDARDIDWSRLAGNHPRKSPSRGFFADRT